MEELRNMFKLKTHNDNGNKLTDSNIVDLLEHMKIDKGIGDQRLHNIHKNSRLSRLRRNILRCLMKELQ